MPNPAVDRISGKSGYVVVKNSRGFVENVRFTSWTAKIKRTFDDVTSTFLYNPRTAITHTAAVPVATSMTVDVAGRFRFCETSKTVVDLMFNSARVPSKVQLGFSPLDPYVEFWAFMEELVLTGPVEGIVDFTCVMRSFGLVRDLTPIICGEDPPVDPNYPGYPDSTSPDYPSPGNP